MKNPKVGEKEMTDKRTTKEIAEKICGAHTQHVYCVCRYIQQALDAERVGTKKCGPDQRHTQELMESYRTQTIQLRTENVALVSALKNIGSDNDYNRDRKLIAQKALTQVPLSQQALVVSEAKDKVVTALGFYADSSSWEITEAHDLRTICRDDLELCDEPTPWGAKGTLMAGRMARKALADLEAAEKDLVGK